MSELSQFVLGTLEFGQGEMRARWGEMTPDEQRALVQAAILGDPAVTDLDGHTEWIFRAIPSADWTMTLGEASDLISVPYTTLVDACNSGRVEFRRSGAVRLVRASALQDAIEAGRLRPRK